MRKHFPKINLKSIKNLKRILLIALGILVILIAASSFVFARHRQLCSYQTAVDNGYISNSSGTNLCPNILSSQEWLNILGLAFNPSILETTTAYDPSLATSDASESVECTDQLNPLCWITGTKPNLKKSEGFTNFLIVGTDTRADGTGSNLQNTDTIMLISLNHTTGQLMFISFPRDLYLDYYRPNGVYVEYKINAVYAIDGVEGLKGVVEQLTGRKIHYYAFIDLKLFEDVITELGGVNITLDEKFSDYYPCAEVPKGRDCPNPKYITDGYFGLFEFKKGTHNLDAFEALVYTRARKNSSDFVRAERQQNLIRAIINDALESDLPITEKVSQYLELYSLFQKRVVSNIELEDVAALLTLAEKLDDKAVQLVTDTSLGGGGLIYYLGVLDGVGYSIGFYDRTHKQFQNYIDNIWNNLPYYLEEPKILVLDGSNEKITKKDSRIKNIIDDNSFVSLKVQQTEPSSGIRIYNVSSKDVSGSLTDIQRKFPGSLIFNAELDEIERSSYEEDILIIIGD